MSEALVVERDGRVATIINNDAPRNRMTLEFIDQLETTIPEIEKDKSIGAVVIRGAGEEHFSVGMNLKQFSEGAKAKGSIFGMLDQRLRVIRKIELSTKPWIATMYGYCLGGGLELPLGCHFRLAAEEGAKRALADVGLDGDEAALDIRDLRSLVDCIRLVRHTAMQTAVRMITTGVMLALLAGIAIKLKIFGGGP